MLSDCQSLRHQMGGDTGNRKKCSLGLRVGISSRSSNAQDRHSSGCMARIVQVLSLAEDKGVGRQGRDR
jgi:hypothetical protein